MIVPCGNSKIWYREPDRGHVQAIDAYTGTPFKLNRRYAERFGDDWVILSAKYGFISPSYAIPGPYEVTFNRKSTNPISRDQLRQQVEDQRLYRFSLIVGLGGKAYREAISAAFRDSEIKLVFPFAGLPIGRMLQATKRALDTGEPGYGLDKGET